MKLYLAGPMRGYPLHNFPAFDQAAEILRERGEHEVINPADHDRSIGFDEHTEDIPIETLRAMMRWDLARIMEVEAVVFLPGWKQSKGACMERALAYYLGLPCYDFVPHGGHYEAPYQLLKQPEFVEPKIEWGAVVGEVPR